MSNKKSVLLAALLTLAALVAAPFFAGCFITADVGNMPFETPGFIRVAAPFLYLAAFTAACAALGAKGKKKAGLAVVIILAVCFLLSGGLTALIFGGDTSSQPIALNYFGLVFMFLNIPGASLIEGFAQATHTVTGFGLYAPTCAVMLTPALSAVALAIGLLCRKRKEGSKK